MFKTMAGLDLFHVPYRGAQVFPAMLAGEAQVYFGPLVSSIGYIRAGNLRPLAVTSTTRAPQLPEVPSLAETFAGFEATPWYGIAAPRDTSPEIVARLSTAVGASLADDKFQARLANVGATVFAGSPADFAKFIADETKKWGKVVVAANLRSTEPDLPQHRAAAGDAIATIAATYDRSGSFASFSSRAGCVRLFFDSLRAWSLGHPIRRSARQAPKKGQTGFR
jgi:hypothetical protein